MGGDQLRSPQGRGKATNLALHLHLHGIEQCDLRRNLQGIGYKVNKGTLSKIISGAQKTLPLELGERIAEALGEDVYTFFVLSPGKQRLVVK